MGILPDSGRVAERLDHEVMGWLTTVTANGRPSPEAMIDEYPMTVRLIPRRVRAW